MALLIQNTKHVCLALGTADINAYFQDIGPPGCFAGWQVLSFWTCKLAMQLTFMKFNSF
jgi:hypothetical protein